MMGHMAEPGNREQFINPNARTASVIGSKLITKPFHDLFCCSRHCCKLRLLLFLDYGNPDYSRNIRRVSNKSRFVGYFLLDV